MRKTLLLTVSLFLAARPTWAAEQQAFRVRGALPWHNFLSGPTAWDEPQYEQYLDRMQKLGLNLLALHNYTGGAQRYMNYVEPMIRMEYRNVLPEAAFDTSMTARWGYRPLAVRDFAYDTAKLFRLPTGAEAYGAETAILARNNQERYARAHGLIRKVVEMAHARGIQVGMGFEFGVYPPELFSVVPEDSYLRANMLPDPTHPASVEILQHTIDDILNSYPGIDWIWFWLQEHETPRGAQVSREFRSLLERDSALFRESPTPDLVFTGVWSLAYIRGAHEYLKKKAPAVRLAIGGWGGGSQLPGILLGLDRGLPREIVFTCLNPSQGRAPQLDVLGRIAKTREVWAIPWLEGDAKLWHYQPRVSLLRDHVRLAKRQGLQGVLAIHWRTEEPRANMEAFARFARDPEHAPSVLEFYRADCREQFGDAAAAEIAPLLARMDSEQWFEDLKSPEYFPYNPDWGRLTTELRERLSGARAVVERHEQNAAGEQKQNLHWLAATLQFTLLLDDVSRNLEPAYLLKERYLLGQAEAGHLAEQVRISRAALTSAPVEELFRTYAGRTHSRGSLGVLSSLNQRLWLEYRELQNFLASLAPKEAR